MIQNTKALVSVIIPAYNAEKYLAECLTSIQAQDHKELEILVVNDGSTDATLSIAREFAAEDPRIRVFDTPNGGASAARNVGLDHANGDFIMFSDADDALLQGAITYLLELQRAWDADIVSTYGMRVSSGKPYRRDMVERPEMQCLAGQKLLIYSLQDHGFTHAVWAKLFKKELVKDVRFPEGKRIQEDSFFLFLCFAKGCTFLFSRSTTYKYTTTPTSVCRSAFDDRFLDVLDLLEEKCRIIQESFPELQEHTYNQRVQVNIDLLVNLYKTTDKQYRQIKKNAIREVIRYQKYFVPLSKHKKKLFFIITHHLYGLSAVVYRLKQRFASKRSA